MGFDLFFEVLADVDLDTFLRVQQENIETPLPAERELIINWVRRLFEENDNQKLIGFFNSIDDISEEDGFLSVYISANSYARLTSNDIEDTKSRNKVFEDKSLSNKGKESPDGNCCDIEGVGSFNYKYSTWFFIQMLLTAKETDNPNYIQYCKTLENAGNYRIVKTNRVRITINYQSSYKGIDKLDIDFESIGSNIQDVKSLYKDDVSVYTKLGMST